MKQIYTENKNKTPSFHQQNRLNAKKLRTTGSFQIQQKSSDVIDDAYTQLW